jgi:enterochelin esterase-like enzyme
MQHLVFMGLVGLLLGACHHHGGTADGGPLGPGDLAVVGAGDAAMPVDAATDAAMPPGTCPAGPGGLDCVFSLWDQLRTACDPAVLTAFAASIDARHGDLPLWRGGRAVFISRAAAAVAAAFNNWMPGPPMPQLCGGALYAAEVAVPSGRNPYKLVFDGTWKLDPENFAFVYDDFAGNPDGRNSVLNTYDSGLGTLVAPDQQLCSMALGRCSPLTTYLPPGYGDPQSASKIYPVLFMHDGQNIYDNHTCCFGHTGWEVNNTMDALIAAKTVEPAVIVGFNHGGANRQREYTGDLRDAFMDFQVNTVQTTAEKWWRVDPARAFVAGSSFGGYITLLLVANYGSVYVGGASLSGAYWPTDGTPQAVQAILMAKGKLPVALYLDNGGQPSDGADSYVDNTSLRDQLAGEGWSLSTAPACSFSSSTLCYYWDMGATHDELAWKARAHLFLTYFFGK